MGEYSKKITIALLVMIGAGLTANGLAIILLNIEVSPAVLSLSFLGLTSGLGNLVAAIHLHTYWK